MRWRLSHRADKRALPLADRHYSRQKPGTPQFVKPGSCLVLLTDDEKALWVSCRPFAQYVKHQWAGSWECAMFRNEGAGLSSELISEAVAATLSRWGKPPELGFTTFVDARKTQSRRSKASPVGACFVRSGWHPVGMTKGGLHAFQLLPCDMPNPLDPQEKAP